MTDEREVVDRMARLHFERDFEVSWDVLDEEEREAQRQESRDAIQGLRAGDSLGNGLVAVPEDPTEAMLAWAQAARQDDLEPTDAELRIFYLAMLRAAGGEDTSDSREAPDD